MGLLLGIAQRTVEVFYGDFKQRFSARKLIPVEAKSLGDHLLLNRIKADLSQPELAVKAGFTVRKIKAWEHDQTIPTEAEWQVMAKILDLDASLRPSGIIARVSCWDLHSLKNSPPSNQQVNPSLAKVKIQREFFPPLRGEFELHGQADRRWWAFAVGELIGLCTHIVLPVEDF